MVQDIDKCPAALLGKVNRINQCLQKLVAVFDDRGISRMQFVHHKHDTHFLVTQRVAQAVIQCVEIVAKELRVIDSLDYRAEHS